MSEMIQLDPVQLTTRLVRHNTVNPPGNEQACIEDLANILSDAGFETTLVPLAKGRPNLIARLGAGQLDRPALCFSGHVDTVPLGDEPWSFDPQGGELRDGRVLGRGTSDMKAGVAAMVIACLQEREHLRAGPGAVLVITSAEETGCEGAAAVAKHFDLGQIEGVIVAEPTNNFPYFGHKGALWLEAIAIGVTAHGSMPNLGVNAIDKAVDQIQRLRDYAFAPTPDAALGAPTLNIGQIHGGLNINSVPDRCSFTLDLRSNEQMNHKALLEELRDFFSTDLVLNEIMNIPSVWTAPDTAFAQRVTSAWKKVTGQKMPDLHVASYFTDGAVLQGAHKRKPVMIIGPGDPALAHKTDESCSIARIQEAETVFRALIRD
jgi:succinyl-diaminopimelate desuccinylase